MLGRSKKKDQSSKAAASNLEDDLAALEFLEKEGNDINALITQDESSETDSSDKKTNTKRLIGRRQTNKGNISDLAAAAIARDKNFAKTVKNSAKDYTIVGLLGKGAYGVVYQAIIKGKPKGDTTTDSSQSTSDGNNSGQNTNGTESSNTETIQRQTSLLNQAGGGTTDEKNTEGDENTTNGSSSSSTKEKTASVAIKVIDLEKPKSSLEDIRNEVTAMKEAFHPNVVACYTAFMHKSALWVVMPYMNLGCCANIMKRLKKGGYGEGMREEWVRTILRETVQGLNYLHEQGYMHRDLKAGNIVLDSSGSIKIADFGVSGLLVTAGADRKVSQTFVGTPCWMAPEIIEQAKGHNSSADIWSLGIVALELGKGYPPYARFEHFTIILKTLQDEPPSLKSYEDEKRRQPSPGTEWCRKSQAYKDLLGLCLRKDPNERSSAKKLLSCRFLKNTQDPKVCCREILAKLPTLSAVQDTKPEVLQGLIQNLMLDAQAMEEHTTGLGIGSNEGERKKKKYHLAAAKTEVTTSQQQQTASDNTDASSSSSSTGATPSTRSKSNSMSYRSQSNSNASKTKQLVDLCGSAEDGEEEDSSPTKEFRGESGVSKTKNSGVLKTGNQSGDRGKEGKEKSGSDQDSSGADGEGIETSALNKTKMEDKVVDTTTISATTSTSTSVSHDGGKTQNTEESKTTTTDNGEMAGHSNPSDTDDKTTNNRHDESSSDKQEEGETDNVEDLPNKDLQAKMEALSSVPRAEGTTWVFNFNRKDDEKKKDNSAGSSKLATLVDSDEDSD